MIPVDASGGSLALHHGITRHSGGRLIGSLRPRAELLLLSFERLTPEEKASRPGILGEAVNKAFVSLSCGRSGAANSEVHV
jgi:hypothetical protein